MSCNEYIICNNVFNFALCVACTHLIKFTIFIIYSNTVDWHSLLTFCFTHTQYAICLIYFIILFASFWCQFIPFQLRSNHYYKIQHWKRRVCIIHSYFTFQLRLQRRKRMKCNWMKITNRRLQFCSSNSIQFLQFFLNFSFFISMIFDFHDRKDFYYFFCANNVYMSFAFDAFYNSCNKF
jgi:hypothetical protein